MEQLIQSLETVNQDSFADDTERARVRNALTSALRQAQHPFDIVYDNLASVSTFVAVRTLIDAGFWKAWAQAGGQPSTTATLSELSSVDPALLRRLLRALAGQKYLLEPSRDTFALTPYTSSLSSDTFTGVFTASIDFMTPCILNFPAFAASINYANPADPARTNLQHWSGNPDATFFSYLAENPRIGRAFELNMRAMNAAKPCWTDIYPVISEIVSPAKTRGSPWLVDIGGGNGHDLERFRVKAVAEGTANLPKGSLILQDQPQVVENAVLTPPCEAQAYDFFTPEKVKGARAYFMHMILHDWSDVDAVKILENVKEGMEKGWSRLLVCETVVASEGANPMSTVSDLAMMMCLGGVERTEEMWRGLAGQAGLRVRKIWTKVESVESVIEMELEG